MYDDSTQEQIVFRAIYLKGFVSMPQATPASSSIVRQVLDVVLYFLSYFRPVFTGIKLFALGALIVFAPLALVLVHGVLRSIGRNGFLIRGQFALSADSFRKVPIMST